MDHRSIPLLALLGISASFACIPHFEHARDHGIFLIPFTLLHEFGSTFASAIPKKTVRINREAECVKDFETLQWLNLVKNFQNFPSVL